MRRLVFLLFLLLLTACGAAVAPQDAAPQTEEAMTAEGGMSGAAVKAEAGFTPATTAAAAGVVRSQDWTKGAPDAVITIIEYGDFQ
jgi:hypothetical protein